MGFINFTRRIDHLTFGCLLALLLLASCEYNTTDFTGAGKRDLELTTQDNSPNVHLGDKEENCIICQAKVRKSEEATDCITDGDGNETGNCHPTNNEADEEAECAEGLQDNDLDGICRPNCDTAHYACSNNGRCNDSSGMAQCDCYAGFVDDDLGNCVPSGFMVTSVRDNLNEQDAEIFSARLEQLGFSRENWDQNITGESMVEYLSYPYAMLYHTGHGFIGGIGTSSGTLYIKDITVNARNTIFATCFTLGHQNWQEVFGRTAQTIMGYTNKSFDITDNKVVELFADYLAEDNSYLSSWYLANSSIENLSDRWAAYTREGEEIVKYSAQGPLLPFPRVAQNMHFETIRQSLLATESVMSDIKDVTHAFGTHGAKTPIDRIERLVSRRVILNELKPTTMTAEEARHLASQWLQRSDHDSDELFFDRVIQISRKAREDGISKTIAYEVRFARAIGGVPIRGNGPADHVRVTVAGNQIHYFSKFWSHLEQRAATSSPVVISAGDVLEMGADEIVRTAKGRTLHIMNVVPVLGLVKAQAGSYLEPAYAFQTADGEQIVLSALSGKMLY